MLDRLWDVNLSIDELLPLVAEAARQGLSELAFTSRCRASRHYLLAVLVLAAE